MPAPSSSCCPPGPRTGASPGDPYFDPSGRGSTRRKPLSAITSPNSITRATWLRSGVGGRAAVSVLGVAVAEHLRRAADHRHAVRTDLRQSLRAIPQHPRPGQRIRRLMDSALHPPHGQEPRHGPARPWLGGPLRSVPAPSSSNHISVVPYPEDNIDRAGRPTRRHRGALLGSDWPHAEGMREPAEQFLRVAGLGDERRKHFMRDNALTLFDD